MKWVKLGDVLKITSGGTPLTSRRDYYDNGIIQWVKTGDLKKQYIFDTPDKITQLGLENSSAKIFPINTVLIAMYGATIGNCSILKVEAATNQACAALLPVDNINEEYLYFYLRTIKQKLIDQGVGGGQPNISGTILKQTDFPLIPLEDQVRIANILSKAEALISQRKESLRLLDELLKSTFLEMFGDPIINPHKFPIRTLSEFYINPKEGTKCGPFGSALKKHEYISKGVPVWIMDNISKDGKFLEHGCLWISEDKFKALESYSVINGDVIISRAGTVGKMCVVKSDFKSSIISTNLIRVRFGKDLLPLHFISLMNYCKSRMAKLRTGADDTFTHMNTGILDGIKFPYPPLKLQTQFAHIVQKAEALKAHYQTSLQELENLYGSLSQRAFSSAGASAKADKG
jgi:type I restriction enzyme, S subunit